MLNKEQVINTISKFPDQFSIDELMGRLILLDKIEKGLKDSEEDNVISEEDLENRINEWSK
ncbi:hypothetical protein OO013_17270 [Mangrovivirga sp. M17]|uniref:Addiction module protein n=1 Tax=Mangrovivirga halotolerans TaxID=2993936 RepID=A0ABT3RVH6_9BACT|nr:hypothetical protein [Mangrovivirga halotolerans]MCX2745636.1 hypothetical protein [Mangrovivirga halotolerans]